MAAGKKFGSGVDGLLDVGVEAFDGIGSSEWPEFCFLVEGIADSQILHPVDELLLKLGGDRLVDDEPFGSDARLAVVDTRASTAVATAASRSALGMTMKGSLPPSSSTTFLIRLAAAIPPRCRPAHCR